MVPKTRTSFYTGSFTVSAPKLWNTFPTSVKQTTSLNTVKRADVAHSIDVQNGFLHFFCLQEPIFDVLIIYFCFETRGVRLPC